MRIAVQVEEDGDRLDMEMGAKVIEFKGGNTNGDISGEETIRNQLELLDNRSDVHDSKSSDFRVQRKNAADHRYGFEVGDLVWGKVKSHPSWPGQIFNDAFASPLVQYTKKDGHVLVAFFGDCSYGWFDPAELIPFDLNFPENSQQMNSRIFMKAVAEAVDEASRRSALGLACRCRNLCSFRPTKVQGYFAIDIPGYYPGGIYSIDQIRKARDSFKPSETLSFVKQLALTVPQSGDHGNISFVNRKALVFAFRKAVFQEYDETYAQAFGVKPNRSSQNKAAVSNEPLRGQSQGCHTFDDILVVIHYDMLLCLLFSWILVPDYSVVNVFFNHH